MRNYENKTKEDLLEIIEQLEKKIDFLSSHSSDSSSPSKGRFRDKYSTRILDALPDMLTVFDHDANIIELASSPATNHVEGINASNITTTNVKDILPEEAYESVRKNMDKVILTGESSTARHDLMLDGVLHHYENRIFPLDNKYLLCMCRDISQQWEAEQTNAQQQKELKAARVKAEESDRLKSAFLANMSHEIRTPLNAIVGFSSLLAEADDDERESYMSLVEENNELLLNLISDILDISKIEAGTVELIITRVDVARLCREVISTCSHKKHEEAVVLRFDESSPQIMVDADKNRIMQVLSNFITNALKFTTKGSVTLSYRLEDDGLLHFCVTDTGKGIPAEQQHEIFSRFVKLDSFSQGAGLGLSICQSLVERMGGQIGVNSREGEGSCFWFTHPYTLDASLDSDVVTKGGEQVIKIVSRNYKPLILVAEDIDSNYLLIEALLRKDYRLLRAHDGNEAIDLFNTQAPDLIFMDMKMPGMNGIDTVVMLRENGAQVPIIALTAFAYDDDRALALNVGCNDFLTKPVSPLELRRMVSKWIGK